MFSPYHKSIGEGKPTHYKAMLHTPLISIYEKRKKKANTGESVENQEACTAGEGHCGTVETCKTGRCVVSMSCPLYPQPQPHPKFLCLHTWFPVGRTIRGGDRTFRRWNPAGGNITTTLKFYSLAPLPVCLASGLLR